MISSIGTVSTPPKTSLWRRPPVGPTGGFTLVEVMLVALLLVLLTTLAAPRFRGAFDDLGRQETVEEIALMMRQARTRARVEGRTYRLQLDLAGGCLWLERELPNSRRGFVPLEDAWGRRRCWPGPLGLEPTLATIVFSASVSGAERRILFRHAERTEYTIVVKAEQIQLQRQPE